jgi:hypothetical protein
LILSTFASSRRFQGDILILVGATPYISRYCTFNGDQNLSLADGIWMMQRFRRFNDFVGKNQPKFIISKRVGLSLSSLLDTNAVISILSFMDLIVSVVSSTQ